MALAARDVGSLPPLDEREDAREGENDQDDFEHGCHRGGIGKDLRKDFGEARQHPSGRASPQKGGCAARLCGGCVCYCAAGARHGRDRHSAIEVVKRVNAVRPAATGVVPGGQRWKVHVEAVLATARGHQSTPADGAGDRARDIARRQESGHGRITHVRSLGR